MFLIGWNHELCRVPYGTLGNLGGGTDECHMALLVGKGLNNVTSDPSEYIFGASSGGIGTSRKIVGNWSFEARFLFDISVMMATMADGLKERENLYKLMIR